MTDVSASGGIGNIADLTALAERALAHWPDRFTDLRLVKLRENAVFRATREDGSRVAVRVHRGDYHAPEALEAELRWQRALAATGISVPPVLPNGDGGYLVEVTHPGVYGPRHVDVLGWLDGAPIGSAEDGIAADTTTSAPIFTRLGALAARMHDHSAHWCGAASAARHRWDADALLGPMPLWGRFWEAPGLDATTREILLRARGAAVAALAAYGQADDRFGLIHADLVPDNVLADGMVLSVIDFDDCGFGWHMFDLATALYFLTHQPDYATLRDALFAGYRSIRELPMEQEALLDLFLFLRGTTYLGWIQTRAETPAAREMAPGLVLRAREAAIRYLRCSSS